MATIPLKLEDLSPVETTFTLSPRPGESFTLCRFSLRVRAWAQARFGPDGLKEVFELRKILEIAELAFYMLKEKEKFPDYDTFLDAIVTTQDQLNVIKALLGAVGIGEPELKKLQAAMDGDTGPNEPSP